MSGEHGMNGHGPEHAMNGHAPLDLTRLFANKTLVVVGGTGFLGKVWLSFILTRFPELGRIYLVVRPKGGCTAEQRFERDVLGSEVFAPLRERYGAGYADFLRSKVYPVAGDVVQPFCGLDPALRQQIGSSVDAVVNVSGVVDFDPPLDEALEVNAFGVQNLVALARNFGGVPLLHTSTCYVAGARTGFVEECDPFEHPFPRAGELDRVHWDPDREIAECLDVIEQARHRSSDAFRQSRFLDEAKKNLLDRGEPARGRVLDSEVQKVKRKFVEARLAEMGMERANFWGFPNTYTYTKAIGEQIASSSGLPFTIVRPAVVESTLSFPFPGWNEGINTSAPLIFILRQGGLQIPGSDNCLDVIPCDMVASGLVLALGELLEGRAKPVYQLGSSDTNPCSMRRFFELTGLYKRRHYQRSGKGGPLLSFLQSHFEGAMLNKEQFHRIGPKAIAQKARGLSNLLNLAATGPIAPLLKPAAEAVEKFSEQQRRVGNILEVFVPFTAQYHYVFRTDNVRAAQARLVPTDRAKVDFSPEKIDWRAWFLDVHVPGLERWVFPQIEEKLRRPKKAAQRHETLPLMLEEMADRYDLAVALQRTEPQGLSRISFRDWRALSAAVAERLYAAGIRRGDRVLLAGENHPAWPIAFFGIMWAGATAVPLDANIEADIADNLARVSQSKILLADARVRGRLEARLAERLRVIDLQEIAQPGLERALEPVSADDVAALIYTSGTTGNPKGVALSQKNLTSLIGMLAPLFPLNRDDRILSVLPLHHTFELTCGMLLPLSRGSRIVYLDELNADRLTSTLSEARITGLVGVPALWEMLERRINQRVAEHGALAEWLFDVAAELNRALGKSLGVDAGRLLFGRVHEELGGHLRFLVSGGAALPESTHRTFAGLGLHLAEGYGLTEASPVLTVAEARPGSKPGHVGKAIPGVEIRIDSPNNEGVGEVLARGPNVMLGYTGDPEATRGSITAEGWLRTGDLGKIDRRGQLSIVGRAKDVIVASNGENVYPDDVEQKLGRIEHVAELAILGISDGRGGERVACAAVPESESDLPRAERHARARHSLESELAKLPSSMRPAVVTLFDNKLPRTATRKVKRNELRRMLERTLDSNAPAALASSQLDAAAVSVRAAIGAISRRDPLRIQPSQSLRGDLGFDSLMLLELLVAFENQVGGSVDAERLNACITVADAEALVREAREHKRNASPTQSIEKKEVSFEVPRELRSAAMEWMGRAQLGFYDKVLSTKVTGRAFIPHNRNVMVAANHASHLDMGLVKYALGSYGDGIVSLAAQDYFFEGPAWRRFYFENFTNLVPMTRSGALRQALRQAGDLIEQGKTLLIFPEGTRGTDGAVHEFKPAVGYLALHHGIDVLPVYLGGTFAALPKGANMLRRRDVEARIGPPLEAAELKRLTHGMPPADAARAVARLIERAVIALSKGEVLDIKRLSPADVREEPKVLPESLETVFRELEGRFVRGSVANPVSFYFSLGDTERWTVRITETSCEVLPGKVTSPADCVLKTSPQMFTRIVRERYTPSPAEFMAGAIKSNNIALLFTFQKAFQLETPSAE
ncbi:MAG: AMP-binding protein [Myxococcota bacterium]